jgi:hypothetical protein
MRLCAFEAERSGGWVQPVVQIAHDTARGSVEGLYGLARETNGGPLSAGAQVRRDGSTTCGQVVRNVRDAAGHRLSRLRFEVVLRPDGTATGRMRPPAGFIGSCSASGRRRVQG